MRMKIGLAQINTIVGDLPGNRDRILRAYRKLVADGAGLVVFPELVVTGYPPRDLLFRMRFLEDAEASLEMIAGEIGEVPAVIGTVVRNRAPRGKVAFNAAAWCENGQVEVVAHKCLLPGYDVFDEGRYFEAASAPLVHEWKDRRIGLTICEDIWTGPAVKTSRHHTTEPLAQLADQRLDLLLNLSASPWTYRKDGTRREIVKAAAAKVQAPIVYVNAIGGNDELIFDGHSLVAMPAGQLHGELPAFQEAAEVIDLASPSVTGADTERAVLSDIHDALVLGLRDYAEKSGFRSCVLGLSGGIDSALVAAIAVEALGPDSVLGISLPSPISSRHSRDDAAALAANLGIRCETLPIGSLVEAAEGTLKGLFKGTARDVTEENIQARARGLLLMAVSNKFGTLLLTTGNKSEISVGYCTLYGDMAGGLAVISDLPKTQVFALSRWINRKREIIPWNTINKPPSAELRPGQKDEDTLPPYEILDEILRLYVEEGWSRSEIVQAGFSSGVVDEIARKVDLNEYKRKQAAPGLKITPLAFGVGRRIPIVQRYVG